MNQEVEWSQNELQLAIQFLQSRTQEQQERLIALEQSNQNLLAQTHLLQSQLDNLPHNHYPPEKHIKLDRGKLTSPITVSTTTPVSTEEVLLGVPAMESIRQKEQTSLPSAQDEHRNGHVGLHSVCAHIHKQMFYVDQQEDNPNRPLFSYKWCPISAEVVLESFGQIRVLVVATI